MAPQGATQGTLVLEDGGVAVNIKFQAWGRRASHDVRYATKRLTIEAADEAEAIRLADFLRGLMGVPDDFRGNPIVTGGESFFDGSRLPERKK